MSVSENLGLSACGGGSSTSAALPLAPSAIPSVEPDSLGAACSARLQPVRFGMEVTPRQLRDPTLAAFIAHQCRVLVAEDAMKPEALSLAKGSYNFGEADQRVDFARSRGQQVRGHTLMWHQAVARWMFREGNGEISLATLITRLERYVTDVAKHFMGRVADWDVVNEACVWGEADSPAATPELLRAQAERHHELCTLLVQKGMSALLTWVVHDAQSWLNTWPVNRFEAPPPFDRQFQPKPAYQAVLSVARAAA